MSSCILPSSILSILLNTTGIGCDAIQCAAYNRCEDATFCIFDNSPCNWRQTIFKIINILGKALDGATSLVATNNCRTNTFGIIDDVFALLNCISKKLSR